MKYIKKEKRKVLSEEHKRKISLAMKGRKLSEEHIKNMSIHHADFSDEKSPMWKGDKAGYDPIHRWIERKLGKPRICRFCKTTTIPRGRKRWFEWANKDHKYKRNLKDWVRLCVPCHRQYDIKNNAYKSKLLKLI